MNLVKEFILAATRQLGRDGGKIVSNKVYKGQHGTPIYNSGQNSGGGSKQVVDISEIDMSIQPPIKGGGIVPVLKGLFFQIFPIIGHAVVLIRGIGYLGKQTTRIYAKVPNRVIDRRYKEGYRIDGYSVIKTNAIRNLQPEERKMIRSRGISYLLSIALGLVFFVILMNSGLISEKPIKYGYVEKSKINIRREPSVDSHIVIQVPQGDSVKIIDTKGPLETLDGEKANWVRIEYEDKKGWVWGGLLTLKE